MHVAFLADRGLPPLPAHEGEAALSRRAFELFMDAAERWGLSLDEQARLLNTSVSSLQRLQRALTGRPSLPAFDEDRLLRLSLIANIDRDLRLSFADATGPAWLRAPNVAYAGRAPLTAMLRDGMQGLAQVFLDVRDWTLGR